MFHEQYNEYDIYPWKSIIFKEVEVKTFAFSRITLLRERSQNFAQFLANLTF